MVKATVLVTSAGSIVAQGIIKSLRRVSTGRKKAITYRIVTVDMNPAAAGLYRSDAGIIVPAADSPTYIDEMIRICTEEGVRAVFVGSEEELDPLSSAAERIKKESAATVLADRRTISIGRDKWKTFEFMNKNRLPCAESALPEDSDEFVRNSGFPIIVKPREGHGSLQVHLVNNRDGLSRAIADIRKTGWKPMLQEFLPDAEDEFTSGVTMDADGRGVMSSISMRRRLKNGQTHTAFIDDFPVVRKAAELTAVKMRARGPVNIQARLDGGIPKAFEVNPRFSASCPMRSVAGVNEPDIVFRNWVLKERLRTQSYRRLVCLRYLNEVYLPYSTFEETVSVGRTENGSSFIADYF